MGTWACGNESPATVLRLAHGLDTRHPVHRALVGMADDLEARSEALARGAPEERTRFPVRADMDQCRASGSG